AGNADATKMRRNFLQKQGLERLGVERSPWVYSRRLWAPLLYLVFHPIPSDHRMRGAGKNSLLRLIVCLGIVSGQGCQAGADWEYLAFWKDKKDETAVGPVV